MTHRSALIPFLTASVLGVSNSSSNLSAVHCAARGGCDCDCSWASSGCGGDDGSCCWGCCCSPGPSPTPRPVGPEGFHQGPILIKQDGHALKLNVAALESGLVTSQDEGSSITIKWGGETRAYVVLEQMDDMPVKNYVNFSLLNRELSYDIDLSTVGCSCNAALFFVTMPGYNQDGSVAHGDYNPYYCDANKVGGVWCWEHDSIESNMHTMTTTPHKCDSPAGKYIASCDKGGCATNAFRVDSNGMCPDARCKIDTRRPFRIHQTFQTDSSSNRLIRIANKLVQGSKSFEWDDCNDFDYLGKMTDAMKELKMVFQLWGDSHGGMSWLDGMTGCSGDCNKDTATVTFSKIEIAPIAAANIIAV